MSDTTESAEKVHYICQTYVEKQGTGGGPPSLKIDKQLQYTSESQAQERAEREFRSEDCAGADAYMVIEDQRSGEVGAPRFLVRLGNVPEFDDF
jgi:hypothetical protein